MKYQKIFDIIQPTLPADWERVVFYAEYEEFSYMMKFFVRSENEKYRDCYNIGLSIAETDEIFEKIDELLKPEWEKGNWTSMTMIVDRNGDFKVDYGHENFSEGYAGYMDDWFAKYLEGDLEEWHHNQYLPSL